jgi:hypothetical protein
MVMLSSGYVIYRHCPGKEPEQARWLSSTWKTLAQAKAEAERNKESLPPGCEYRIKKEPVSKPAIRR